MITTCKKCGAMFDETVETCPDCQSPNPWFEDPSKFNLLDNPFALLTDGSNDKLVRTLLVFGSLNMCWAMMMLFMLVGTPWSKLPPANRVSDIASLVLGVASLALAFRSDLLEVRPIWRVLARVVLLLDIVSFASLALLR